MPVCPAGRAQAAKWGGLMLLAESPWVQKELQGLGGELSLTSRLSECCTAWFPRTAGGEVKGEREELPPRNPVPRQAGDTPCPQVRLYKGKIGEMATTGSLREGQRAVPSQGKPASGLRSLRDAGQDKD